MSNVNQTPLGWSQHPESRAWLIPTKTPQTEQLKKLKAENEVLHEALQSVMERLTALENGGGEADGACAGK